MHRFDDSPLDPDAEAALAVIDATLAGDAVEPEHAELAELSLILAGQRSVATPAFTAELDARVAHRFAPVGGPAVARRRRRWWYAPGATAGLAAAAAVVIVVSAGSSPSAIRSPGSTHGPVTTATSAPAAGAPEAAGKSVGAGTSSTAASTTAAAPTTAGSGAAAPVPSSAGTPAPVPPGGGRQIVQSAQLSLSTRPDRVDAVAQQVFDVVGAEKGVVATSTVTAANGSGGYAQFQLSVPSANLEATMAALSQLRGAAVLSRTDSSQDVTGQLGGAGRRLADARALRTSLLRQLAAATTTTEIDSLQAQIHDTEASISSDLATLGTLHGQVDTTQIAVTINASMAPGLPAANSGSFTLGKAAHDARRVLVTAAGLALIALAVLLPLGLIAAMLAWPAFAVRRHRREQMLDRL